MILDERSKLAACKTSVPRPNFFRFGSKKRAKISSAKIERTLRPLNAASKKVSMTYAINQKNKKKLQRGCHIVLKRGKGLKRRYNGKEASVVEYPSRGSWMTVATNDENNVLKWRKGQCIFKTKDNTNILDDGMWCYIFGFLVN